MQDSNSSLAEPIFQIRKLLCSNALLTHDVKHIRIATLKKGINNMGLERVSAQTQCVCLSKYVP